MKLTKLFGRVIEKWVQILCHHWELTQEWPYQFYALSSTNDNLLFHHATPPPPLSLLKYRSSITSNPMEMSFPSIWFVPKSPKKLKKMKHQGKYVINSAHQPCLHTRAYRPCKPLHPIHVNVDLGSIVQGSDLVNKHNHIASYSYPLLSGFVAHRAWTQWNLNQMYQTNMWRD